MEPYSRCKTLAFFCLLSAPLLAPAYTVAQTTGRTDLGWDNPIETDGPDFTEASSVIPARTVQVETGAGYYVDKAEGITQRTLAYPATLLRISVLPNLEFRAIGEFVDNRFSFSEARPDSVMKGLTPLLLGTKIFICEEEGWRPEASFIGHVTLTSGSLSLRPAFSSSEFRFALSNSLSDRFDLGYNLGYEWDGFSTQGQGIYTLALGYSISQRWGAYVELYGDKPEGDPFTHGAAGGVKFLLTPNWQMDISGGNSLNNNADDYYFAYGFRFRLPY